MGAVLAAWMVEIGVQVWKGGAQIRVPPGLPVPSIFLADMIVFGALAFGAKESSSARPVAGLLAWGLVVATFLNYKGAPATALANVLNKGNTTATPASTAPVTTA